MTQTAVREQEALHKARTGQALTNYPAIIKGFMEKGIPADDIKPRENVFTYRAWRALGRQVKKGEHGVKILTYIESSREVEQDDGTVEVRATRRPWTTTVFHVSQTQERA